MSKRIPVYLSKKDLESIIIGLELVEDRRAMTDSESRLLEILEAELNTFSED